MGETIDLDPLHLSKDFIMSLKLPLLKFFSPQEVKQKMETHRKILFVRDPFDRLVSAFRNKLEIGADKRLEYGRDILREYRTNVSEVLLRTGEGVTFPEFLRFLSEHGLDDRHWSPQYELCKPCHINYDFIGHYENLEVEANYVIRNLANHFNVKCPKVFDIQVDNYIAITSKEDCTENCKREKAKGYLDTKDC